MNREEVHWSAKAETRRVHQELFCGSEEFRSGAWPPLVPLWCTLQSAQKVCVDKWDLSRKSCPLTTLLYNSRCGIQTSVQISWKTITHIWQHICNIVLWFKKKKKDMCSRSMFMYMEILWICFYVISQIKCVGFLGFNDKAGKSIVIYKK